MGRTGKISGDWMMIQEKKYDVSLFMVVFLCCYRGEEEVEEEIKTCTEGR